MVFSSRHLPNYDATQGRALKFCQRQSSEKQSRIVWEPMVPRRQGLRIKKFQGEEPRDKIGSQLNALEGYDLEQR